MASHSEMKTLIGRRLVESGEKERLRDHLRTRLIQAGWRDKMKLEAKERIKAKGLDRVRLEDLVAEMTPVGRQAVPDEVKRELLAKIKDFLAQQQNI